MGVFAEPRDLEREERDSVARGALRGVSNIIFGRFFTGA